MQDKNRNGGGARGWEKPIGVTAGFLAFCLLCGALDTAALADDYTPLEPVTQVKNVYVDPPEAQACPISQNDNSYPHVGALSFSSSEADAPAPANDQAAVSAALAETAASQTSKVASLNSPVVDSVFRSRFESFRVTPSAPPAQEEAAANLPADSAAGTGVMSTPRVPPKTVSVSSSAGCFEKMKAWKAQYPDVVGYIKIPGTNIDYPVVWNANNLYYEHLDINKQPSVNGVIWADQDVTTKSRNTVLYGHNWTNYSSTPRVGNASDVMFAQLTGYQYASFAQSHPTIQYANADGDGTYVVFGAIYTTDLNYYINTNRSPTTLLKQAKAHGLYNVEIDVKDTDKTLTLSTCTRYYGKFEAQRFIVLARKLRDGEKLDVTISAKK